ncbi:Clavaminate synthase-like protein [Coprinopsis marcescibilis]|uniref:Clavaminate synthase-like protein n=1 Tax=Coprinopsis marcescibilis TaxID=230819 RepID=A0A5C3LBM2_COPMA|nr:Clavaminate synthase-like protein [Coprinopsis marcescibilis]
MRSAAGQDLYVCRTLHIDCSILKALAEASLSRTASSIESLDYALIISGAPTNSRYDLIHGVIDKLQSAVPPSDPQANPNDACPLTEQNTPELADDRNLASAHCTVPRILPPSLAAFQSDMFRCPFIISGYAKHWPALREHPWRRSSYLRSVAGPGRVVPIEVGEHYMVENWNQRIMSWDEFLSMLDFEDQPTRTQPDEKHYLAQHDLFIQFPALRNDILIPDYAYATNFDCDFPGYRPPANEERIISHVWLGPEHTISPAHTDPYNNLFVQVVGHKTVWLAPPSTSEIMTSRTRSLQNTSPYDVFGDVDEIFRRNVAPHAMTAVLNPGDLLYFPVGWWHAMRSESTSFSLSLWF